ncbi:MAG TPA: LPS export ABC transporter ATP-binding protein [Gemmataceae bacterium]|nr:LPS export ABC transporter ATP-binding protein [Gemmataceae bacterium]
MPLLEVRGLVKIYGRRRVVDGVDFQVEPGEVVGLLGPNGAGKTTSFRMTTGQITPNEGAVFFNGHEVTTLPMYMRARLGMGYLPQEVSVFRKLTTEQNILAILEILPVVRSLGRKMTSKERWQRTDQVLEQFGLTHVRKNNAARLSGGEKRRLEIARCLVCEPLLILLDEPFTGIDPITIADIRQIVRDLRNTGIGMLLTDHNVREALKITDRSYLIKDGKVRTHGSPHDIVNDPIAINEYLGQGFNDDFFMRPPGQPAAPRLAQQEEAEEPQVHQVLEQEKIHRLIDRLKTEDQAAAVAELLQRGLTAVPALIEALERRDVDMRAAAHLILQQILGQSIPFDPYAPESPRRQQILGLREQLVRKAG